jgi:hypothetical protein
MADPPSGTVASGTTITLTPTAGGYTTISYTLDGSDPRTSATRVVLNTVNQVMPVITGTSGQVITLRAWRVGQGYPDGTYSTFTYTIAGGSGGGDDLLAGKVKVSELNVLTTGIQSVGNLLAPTAATTWRHKDAPPSFNLANKTLTIMDNFRYDVGYSTALNLGTVSGWGAIKAGDAFEIDMTFTSSRDFEETLYLYLIDNTEEADYWLELNNDDDDNEIPETGVIKAGTTYNYKGVLRATRGPIGTDAIDNYEFAIANSLTFTTGGAGTQSPAANDDNYWNDNPKAGYPAQWGGTKGDPVLTFTKFTITKYKAP